MVLFTGKKRSFTDFYFEPGILGGYICIDSPEEPANSNNQLQTIIQMQKTNPLKWAGILLLAIGTAMLVIAADLLMLGGREEYYRWEFILLFFALLSLLHGRFTSFVILVSVGAWFLVPDLYPHFYSSWRDFFWPAVLILVGITLFIPKNRKLGG